MSGLCNQATPASPADVTAAEAGILAAIAAIPAGGLPSTLSIVNGGGAAPVIFTTAGNITQFCPVVAALSGVLGAGVLSTVLNIVGGGYLDVFAVSSVDATNRTHRVKITLDGVVVLDKTTVGFAGANFGYIAVGSIATFQSNTNVFPVALPVRFNTSCLVEYASSLPETDKTNIFYAYRTTA